MPATALAPTPTLRESERTMEMYIGGGAVLLILIILLLILLF